MADQAPRLRLPATVHAPAHPLYEGQFAEHPQSEQDVTPNMDDLSPHPQHRNSPSVYSPGDCGERCHIIRSAHRTLPSNHELLPFTRDRHNLILDSIDPSITPHIVVTPPDYPYDGYWAFVQNGVGPQLEVNALSVPPFVSGRSVVWPPWQDRHYVWHTSQYARAVLPDPSELPYGPLSTSYEDASRKPGAVFNLARFGLAIQAAEQERLVIYHVIPSLHRIHFKATVILASSVAFNFRRRWDRPGFRNNFEKPFHWTDAAEPLLAMHSRDPLSLILDSVHPCTVPHIIITEAPQQDPWEAIVNNTPTPQDCGFGYYLTVPCSLVDFVNTALPDHVSSHTSDDLYFASVADGGGYESSEMGSFSESESDDESPMPLTPPSNKLELDMDVVASDDTCFRPTTRTTDFYIYDDEDDEDDLPPFDDWYLDIAQRAALSC